MNSFILSLSLFVLSLSHTSHNPLLTRFLATINRTFSFVYVAFCEIMSSAKAHDIYGGWGISNRTLFVIVVQMKHPFIHLLNELVVVAVVVDGIPSLSVVWRCRTNDEGIYDANVPCSLLVGIKVKTTTICNTKCILSSSIHCSETSEAMPVSQPFSQLQKMETQKIRSMRKMEERERKGSDFNLREALVGHIVWIMSVIYYFVPGTTRALPRV